MFCPAETAEISHGIFRPEGLILKPYCSQYIYPLHLPDLRKPCDFQILTGQLTESAIKPMLLITFLKRTSCTATNNYHSIFFLFSQQYVRLKCVFKQGHANQTSNPFFNIIVSWTMASKLELFLLRPKNVWNWTMGSLWTTFRQTSGLWSFRRFGQNFTSIFSHPNAPAEHPSSSYLIVPCMCYCYGFFGFGGQTSVVKFVRELNFCLELSLQWTVVCRNIHNAKLTLKFALRIIRVFTLVTRASKNWRPRQKCVIGLDW